MPLLAGGMERSMDLAEAMEARGFSRGPATSRATRPIVVQAGLAPSSPTFRPSDPLTQTEPRTT